MLRDGVWRKVCAFGTVCVQHYVCIYLRSGVNLVLFIMYIMYTIRYVYKALYSGGFTQFLYLCCCTHINIQPKYTERAQYSSSNNKIWSYGFWILGRFLPIVVVVVVVGAAAAAASADVCARFISSVLFPSYFWCHFIVIKLINTCVCI